MGDKAQSTDVPVQKPESADAPTGRKKGASINPKTAAAAAIGIGAVAAAVLFASKRVKKTPSIPKAFKPESD